MWQLQSEQVSGGVVTILIYLQLRAMRNCEDTAQRDLIEGLLRGPPAATL